ncbi:MAG: hypothetical protein ACC655_11810, partial [Rhodothermia bacterium]
MKKLSPLILVWALIFGSVFTAPSIAQQTAYDRVGDDYPKNSAIDILNYTFELQLTDNSDTIRGIATIDARYL